MAIPSSPAVSSRAVYYPDAVPAPTVPTIPAGGPTPAAGAGNFGFNPVPSNIPPDCGSAGVALPATVVALGGVSPDYQGMVLAVHTLNGAIVMRSANFTSGQPLLNQATWATQGSNAAQARWALVDALS